MGVESLGLVLLFTLGLLGSRLEAYDWNSGWCRDNGLPWRYFDTDSQGGRGYNAGDQTTWQSWRHDK
jgi:hypothetical protein